METEKFQKEILFHKKNIFLFLTVLLICACVFFVVRILSDIKSFSYIGIGVNAPTISFSGTGEIWAVPDIASISFSIIENGKTMKEAQDKVAKKIKDILNQLKNFGIEEKDLKTEFYNAYPQYKYSDDKCTPEYCPPKNPPQIIGFEVNQMINVKVREIEKSGEVIDILSRGKVTNISGPNFEIDNPEKLKEEARDKAIKNAQEKAEKLAKSLNVRLGRLVSFSESGDYYPLRGLMTFAKEVTQETEITPSLPVGENKIVSQVTLTYEIIK